MSSQDHTGQVYSYTTYMKKIHELNKAYEKSEIANAINHPPHYTAHPSGVECIQITEHMGFNLGNAIKYIWRADLKGNAIEDLKKAVWYVNKEIERRQKNNAV